MTYTDKIQHLKTYFTELRKAYQDGSDNSSEFDGRTPLHNLLKELAGKNFNIKQEKYAEGVGIPDFTVKDDSGRVTGYLETKKPGTDCLKIAKSDQIKKYSSINENVLITNYHQFYWLKSEELITCYSAEELKDYSKKLKTRQLPELETMLSGFLGQKPEMIGTAKELADALAEPCRLLHYELKKHLAEHETGRLYGIYDAFVKQVSNQLTSDEFADVFAQTLSYGLLMARLNQENNDITLSNIQENIPKSVPLIGELVGFLDELEKEPFKHLSWIVESTLSIINNLNQSEIEKSLREKPTDAPHKDQLLFDHDPFICFYENFIKAYNQKKRKELGVYYTPQPVVNFIVRGINDLLKDKLGCGDGLADSEVTVLDFACGTGTFMLETIRQIFESQSANPQKLLDDHICKNIFGFELLIAPYIVAHMKLQQFIKNKNLELKGRLPIYLANTLEPIRPQMNHLLPALSEESSTAKEIKDQDILVIMGNPPYNVESKNKGDWITEKIGKYKYICSRRIPVPNIKSLQNDYVKFICFAEYKLEKMEKGIVGVITSHSFLNAPTFMGMRYSLMESFDQIYILDLHGNLKEKELIPEGKKDENVFEIKEGVAISFFIKKKGLKKKIYHADLWGSRDDKYKQTAESSYQQIEWQEVKPQEPRYSFTPFDYKSYADYKKLRLVTDIFPKYSSGITTGRDKLTMQFSSDDIKKVVKNLASLTSEEASDKYKLKADTEEWRVKSAQKSIIKHGQENDKFSPILYRPFDERHTYYTPKSRGFISRPRGEIMTHMLHKDNLGLVTVNRSLYSNKWQHVGITNKIVERYAVSNKGENNYLFPLYKYEEPNDKNEKTENIDGKFRQWLDNKYHTKFSPEELFYYVYAVLHCPIYRDKYVDFLRIEFPRIPFPDKKEDFIKLVKIGNKLADLHLLKDISPNVEVSDKVNYKVEEPRYQVTDKRLYINQDNYFSPVSPEVWDFQLGGYKVVDKYLTYRNGRDLSFEEIRRVKEIISVLAETLILMPEIDEFAEHFI